MSLYIVSSTEYRICFLMQVSASYSSAHPTSLTGTYLYPKPACRARKFLLLPRSSTCDHGSFFLCRNPLGCIQSLSTRYTSSFRKVDPSFPSREKPERMCALLMRVYPKSDSILCDLPPHAQPFQLRPAAFVPGTVNI